MIVYLQATPYTAHTPPQHQTDNIMGPQPPPPLSVFDSRTQIIDNCEFLGGKDDIIQVITSKDPASNNFKAYAVRCNDDTREGVLASEPCKTAQKAVESLHTKSCEAVHNYITTNGFLSPRDFKLTPLDLNTDPDDVASIISNHSDSSTAALSEWGSSGDEAMMLHHTPSSNGGPEDEQRLTGRRGSHTTAATCTQGPVGESRSRVVIRDPDELANKAPPRARHGRSPSPPTVFRQALPPPPPGRPVRPVSDRSPTTLPPSMRGIPLPPPPRHHPSVVEAGLRPFRAQHRSSPPTSLPHLMRLRVPGAPADGPDFQIDRQGNRPSKPSEPDNNSGDIDGKVDDNSPSRPFSLIPPTLRSYVVRITVIWLHHGQHRIIAQCQPTRESLQSAAVRDVHMNPGSYTFDNRGAEGGLSPGRRNAWDNNRSIMRAHVRQAVFAGESYDMRTFHGQDLTRLFQIMSADDSIPSFEIVVEDVSHDASDHNADDRFREPPRAAKDDIYD